MGLSLFVAAGTFFVLLLFAVLALEGLGWSVDARVRALAEPRPLGAAAVAGPFGQRVIVPALEALGAWFAALLPAAFVRRTERRLALAGWPMRLSAYYTLCLGLGAMLAGAYVVLVFAVAQPPAAAALLPAPMVAAVGALVPTLWLSARARARRAAMMRALPDALDLLTLCVEAGVGLDAALQRVAERQSGPFADELRLMLGEIALGKTRRQALLDLAGRVDIDDVRGLANAVIQAEQLGTSLRGVLRAQAQRLRVRRRQMAEQQARRAPVKMVFPLVFCLMPSLFIFILGPGVVSIWEFVKRP